jgi:serine protease Do
MRKALPLSLVALLLPSGIDAQAPRAVARDLALPADSTGALALSSAFRSASDRAMPAVVFIAVEQAAAGLSGEQLEGIPEQWREYFGVEPQNRPRQGTGSGFIIDGQGHIITNTHVVENATSVLVRLADGREYTARVVGTDVSTDIALIRIDPPRGEQLAVAPMGDSDAVQVGDWVLALGSPLGLDFTVTAGIISAKHRQISAAGANLESFIQTDAVINPGNSGGPLVDLSGRVVGVNSAIFGSDRFVGYGFAVPINLVRRVAGDLLEHGYMRRPMIGATVRSVAAVDAEIYRLQEVRGALLAGVARDGPAAKAGLRAGDVVLALNGRPMRDDAHLITTLAEFQPGERVNLDVVRERSRQNFAVQLGEFPRTGTPAVAPMRGSGEAAERDVARILGFSVRDITPRDATRASFAGEGGVVVAGVQPYGAASMAQVRPGMIILAVNGERVRSARQVEDISRRITAGSAVSLLMHDTEFTELVVNYRTRQ